MPSEKDDFISIAPRELLTTGEQRSIAALLEERKKLSEQWRSSSREEDREAILRVDEEITGVAELALDREIGLKKYMVIDVLCKDDHQAKLQFLQLNILEGFQDPHAWTWMISGRNLRKDGALGEKEGHIRLRDARIKRRKLDGSWEILRRKPVNK
jgi:hypothetical protein